MSIPHKEGHGDVSPVPISAGQEKRPHVPQIFIGIRTANVYNIFVNDVFC